jgi:hypothetical protein
VSGSPSRALPCAHDRLRINQPEERTFCSQSDLEETGHAAFAGASSAWP